MKNYEVCGPSEVLGHSPGKTFQAELSTVQEEQLVEGGALRVVKDPAPETSPTVPSKSTPVGQQKGN